MDTYAKKLSIQLNIRDLERDKVNVLYDLIKYHEGSQTLNFVIYDNAEKIKVQMPSRKNKVKISQELLNSLKEHDVMYKLN